MIVVRIDLVSARDSHEDAELGTLVIDNITGQEKHAVTHGRSGDYRVRMYRRGALTKAEGSPRKLVSKYKPVRQAEVHDHPRLVEPVQNLVLKALDALGYK